MVLEKDGLDTTFFSSVTPFPVIGEDNKIPTEAFLFASKGIVELVDLFGTLFTPVRSDINGNITKLRTIYDSNPHAYSHLNSVVEVEKKTIPAGEFKIGTDALMWLTRALHYIKVFLQSFLQDYDESKKSEDLTPYFTEAYDQTLRKHHNWFVQKIFTLCLNAAPARSGLISLLANPKTTAATVIDDTKETLIFSHLKEHLILLDANILAVYSLFDSHGVEY